MKNRAERALPVISWNNRTLDFSKKIYVMGILNVTPDSFYAGSRIDGPERARATAEEMIAAGVDIIDIGGESTRPGSRPVGVEEEAERVLPCVRAVRERYDVLISVDTRKRAVAEAALAAGADLVNTVSGLRDDDDFADMIARAGVPVVLMHMKGTPLDMQDDPLYDDAAREIRDDLQGLVEHALERGIAREKIIIDPGIGFGKRVQDNLALIKGLPLLRELGYPVLIGLSRKSFLESVTGKPVGERLTGTIAANTAAALAGANILRVHDVAEAVDVARLVQALREL